MLDDGFGGCCVCGGWIVAWEPKIPRRAGGLVIPGVAGIKTRFVGGRLARCFNQLLRATEPFRYCDGSLPVGADLGLAGPALLAGFWNAGMHLKGGYREGVRPTEERVSVGSDGEESKYFVVV